MDVRRKVNGGWALAALLGCVALLVSAPAALAVETGKISGTVTEAVSKNNLKNIEVSVYEAHGKEFEVGFAVTNEKGEYTVEGLPHGEYKVEFFESNQNFVTQFYNKQSSFATANVVEVVIGEPAKSEKIDAELEVGGQVEGTVIDASTHNALANVIVEARGPGEAPAGFVLTNASGHYTMSGLMTGSYKIVFLGAGYVTQYYNNQPSPASANSVAVVQKSVTTGINAALIPKAPINTSAPIASGTPAVGQKLSCASGSWTGTPAPTFTYAWLHDGVPIHGATASTYVVQTNDQGNGLTCKVTASNNSGTAAAVSNTLIVPIPPPPPPKPVITLLTFKIIALGNSARTPIVCANATCAGKIELTRRFVVRRRHGRKIKRTLVLGRASYVLAAGHSATISVPLTSTARHALATAKHHRLSARVSVSVVGGATVVASVVLSKPASKHKHRHR